MVTSLERVVAALSFQEADRIPVVPLMLGASRRISGASYPEWSTNAEVAATAILQSQEFFRYDALFAALDLSVEAEGFGATIIYPDDDTAHPDYDAPLLRSPEDYSLLKPFDPKLARRTSAQLRICEILLNTRGKDVAVLGFTNGPLCTLSMLRGSERLFVDCLKHPNEVHHALEIVTQVLVSYVRAQCEKGVPGICIDVLFAARGTLSKKMWEEFEAPYARRIADEIRRNGAMVSLHNCGTGPYFDSMIQHLAPVAISYHCLPMTARIRQNLKINMVRRWP
ncbi:MAG: uroporphyrinogen decarboxylase family protein [Dehalococcoidia bacterium]